MEKIKLVFILPSLRVGGAERVMSYIAQNMNNSIFQTTLLVAGYKCDSAFEVEGIKTEFFNKKRALYAFYPIFKYIFDHKPQIVISAISNLNVLMGLQSLFFPKTFFIGREVSVESVLSKIEKPKRYIPTFLHNFAYGQLDRIICQSNDMAIEVRDRFKFKPNKLTIINNPISEKFTLKQKHIRLKELQFITIGTLTKRKGHIRILDVLSKISFAYTYTLIGDGPDKMEILRHAEKLGLLPKIRHIPFTSDVVKHLNSSDVFLQGSYVEGFPNALLESLAVGTPALAFNAPGGINEIIENGINGYIAEDQIEYLEKLHLICGKEWNPTEVRNSVTKKYAKNIIIREYENLFLSLVKN